MDEQDKPQITVRNLTAGGSIEERLAREAVVQARRDEMRQELEQGSWRSLLERHLHAARMFSQLPKQDD